MGVGYQGITMTWVNPQIQKKTNTKENIAEEKNENKMRIKTIQLNGYLIPPMRSRGKAKTIILKKLISNMELDIILIQEINKNWSLIEKKDRPKYKFDHIGIVTNHSYNNDEYASNRTHLQGGTAVWMIGAARGYVKKHKNDQKGIGRWARMDCEGADMHN